jgi:hypothetical protein
MDTTPLRPSRFFIALRGGAAPVRVVISFLATPTTTSFCFLPLFFLFLLRLSFDLFGVTQDDNKGAREREIRITQKLVGIPRLKSMRVPSSLLELSLNLFRSFL